MGLPVIFCPDYCIHVFGVDDLPELSLFDIFYPFALLIAAGGFWSVLKLRPEMHSALWFALSLLCGALAFGVEFASIMLPESMQALFGAGFYSGMASFFVFGLILRAGRKPPYVAISAIASVSVLLVFVFSLIGISVLVRVGMAQFSSAALLLIALFYARHRFTTLTDRAVIAIMATNSVLLCVQPFIVWYMIGLPSANAEYDTSGLFMTMGMITTLFTVCAAMLLVREYIILIIEDLKFTANRDKLTGLLNRRGFEDEAMESLIAQTRTTQFQVAIILFDIDHFKLINDTYGHGIGDDILRGLGNLLSAHKGKDGVAARLGGEEFVLAIPAVSLEAACAQAELLRERVARQTCYDDATEVKCTASFGVSLCQPGEPFACAIARADEALYGAKQTGRNQVKSEADLQVAKLRRAVLNMKLANEGGLHIADHAKQAPIKTS